MVAVVAALLTLGAMLLANSAGAAHLRPKGATPLVAPLTVAYDECTAPNEVHNPVHLAAGTCSPPTRSSHLLTVGDPIVNGSPAAFRGQLKLAVSTGASTTDIKFVPDPTAVTGSGIQDVRCGDLTGSACTSTNDTGPPDYTGILKAEVTMRITDHDSGPSGGPYTNTGTAIDLEIPVPFICSSTGPTVGATCVPPVSTMNALCGGCIGPMERMNMQISRLVVVDGGTNANPFDTTDGPNEVFAEQGIFIP